MEINKEILEKVERIELEKNYLSRCLNVHICPKCGRDVDIEPYDDGGAKYWCKSQTCDFKHVD